MCQKKCLYGIYYDTNSNIQIFHIKNKTSLLERLYISLYITLLSRFCQPLILLFLNSIRSFIDFNLVLFNKRNISMRRPVYNCWYSFSLYIVSGYYYLTNIIIFRNLIHNIHHEFFNNCT